MTPSIVSGPAAEPVSLADVKNWIKVEDTSQDQMMQSLITSARLAVEAATNRLLISQQWRLSLDAWPGNGLIVVPFTPVRAITGIRVFDGGGTPSVVPSSVYSLDATLDHARILLAGSLPVPGKVNAGISIDLLAGYGDAAAAVPEPFRLAMLQLVAYWFADRGDGDAVRAALPATVRALLAPFRIRRLA